MNIDNLKEYLGIVLDLEKNILLRKHLITRLTENINQLGISRTFIAPVKPQEWIPPASSRDEQEYIDESPDTSIGHLVLVGIGIFFLAFIVLMILDQIAGGISDQLAVILLFLPIIFWIGYIVDIRQDSRKQREDAKLRRAEDEKRTQQKREQAEKAWRTSMSCYHSALRTYQQDVAKDKERVQFEEEKKVLLRREIEELTRDQAESEQRLAQVYAKNIIFPKYQNLVAVSSLYEYICAGRCFSLEGHEGAYNIYEAEVRLDRIITQMDQVIEHLDAIRNNQFVLFTAVQEINQQCAQILRSVQDIDQKSMHILEAAWSASDNIALQIDSIGEQTNLVSAQLQELQKTSALAAYHMERTQKELAYMNRIDYLAGRNDDVFWNHPPV